MYGSLRQLYIEKLGRLTYFTPDTEVHVTLSVEKKDKNTR